MGLFSPEPFRVLLSDIIFPSVFTSHRASISRVSEVSKIVLTFFMMSEKRWMAVENVALYGMFHVLGSLLNSIATNWERFHECHVTEANRRSYGHT